MRRGPLCLSNYRCRLLNAYRRPTLRLIGRVVALAHGAFEFSPVWPPLPGAGIARLSFGFSFWSLGLRLPTPPRCVEACPCLRRFRAVRGVYTRLAPSCRAEFSAITTPHFHRSPSLLPPRDCRRVHAVDMSAAPSSDCCHHADGFMMPSIWARRRAGRLIGRHCDGPRLLPSTAYILSLLFRLFF